jgi:hypothetical protein
MPGGGAIKKINTSEENKQKQTERIRLVLHAGAKARMLHRPQMESITWRRLNILKNSL